MNHPTLRSERASQHGGTLGMLLAWITSVMILLLVLELGLRILPIPLAAPVVTINEPDPTFGWVKRKNDSTSKSTSEYDVTFSINHLGLRDDDDLTREKPAGKKRVLVVGDSFVLGYTVSREDHFVDLLEDALVTDHPEVQVLNGGTEGYSTDQELVWLREEGLTFQPDVVVLCFYQNDVYWNGQPAYVGKAKPRFPPTGNAEKVEVAAAGDPAEVGVLARHTALGGLFYNLRTAMEYGAGLTYSAGSVTMPKEETVTLKNAPAALGLEDCWKRTEACLRGFKDTSAANGAKLLLVAIPNREQVQEDSKAAYLEKTGLTADQFDPHIPSRRILAAAARDGIDHVDPLQDLVAAAKDEGPMYYQADWHLNPAGNRILARSIYQRLSTADYLGGGSTPAGLAAIGASAAPRGGLPTWVIVVTIVWLVLSTLYGMSYQDENFALAYLKCGALIGSVVLLVAAVNLLAGLAGPKIGSYIGVGAVLLILGFVLVKSWSKLGIIREVYGSFVRSGHWYMIPLLVAMLTIGSLLIVASSSPFIAPFIYTLF